MIVEAICILLFGIFIGASLVRYAPYTPSNLHEELADAAIRYCEHKRLNRMESFQRAAWDRYVAVALEVEEVEEAK